MIHRTFRSLDQAPKLVGFTMRQWCVLIAGASVVLGLVYLAHLPTKPAITLCVFFVGLPAALTYVSESGGLQLGALLRDMCRWRFGRHRLPATPPATPARAACCSSRRADSYLADDIAADGRLPDPALEELLSEERWGAMRRARCAADLLGVAAIGEDGLLVREDGEYVRYLEVGSVNPLVMEQAEGERVSAAFGQLAARLPDRQSLQLYVQGTPLDLEDVLAEETHRCEQAAGAAEDVGEDERATAIRRLGIAQEQSIRATALNVAPLTLRYLVICPWRPAGRPLLSGGVSRRSAAREGERSRARDARLVAARRRRPLRP